MATKVGYFKASLENDLKHKIIQFKQAQQILNSSSKTSNEEEDLKNIRQRKDKRWEWRKTINGQKFYVIKSTQKECLTAKTKILKDIKNKTVIEKKPKESHLFIDLAWAWFRRYKENIASAKNYKAALNVYLCGMDADINSYTKDYIQDFLNDIVKHRMAQYCHIVIRNVFEDAQEKGLIKKDITAKIKKPENKGKKGTWFNLAEQTIILNNLDKCKIGEEILFYIMTGCRRSEAFNIQINFDKRNIFIDGTKTSFSKRYVEISTAYAERLKLKFNEMFKHSEDYYTREFKDYIESLKIYGKTLHSLRHTCSTNLYYLGVPDKKRQYILGHASIAMTNDIYTTLDPSITKKDILKLYNNLYPRF